MKSFRQKFQIWSALLVTMRRPSTTKGHSGLPDEQPWPKVQQEQRMLFTADKGFANAHIYPPGSHAGVVLFRLPRESRAGYIRLAEFLIATVDLGEIAGAIVVVSPDAIRVLRA